MFNIEELKRKAIKVFETKKRMLDYISKLAFRQKDKLVIYRVRTKWIVYFEDKREDKSE